MMYQNFQISPECRSITAISVVEDVSKCPLGYTPILRTHDQDADADLWKDGFFGKRVTRYVCVSKTQGRPDHVVQSIQIIYDKELPPDGFAPIVHTIDTTQRAFKKKQLCFKLAHFRSNCESIAEVVILSKLKSPPDGFDHIGDINGMHFCIRKISALTRLNSPSLSYGLPGMIGSPNPAYPNIQQSLQDLSLNTSGSSSNGISPRPYNNGPSSMPNSPPIQPYQQDQNSNSGNHFQYNSPNAQHQNQHHYHNPPLKYLNTISQISVLDGIPFVLHEDLQTGSANGLRSASRINPTVSLKSETELENEFSYDFVTERHVLLASGN